MENRTHAIIAICFLIVFILAAIFIFRWVSSAPAEPLTYRIVTDQSVAGIAPMSAVEFKGLQVGHVAQVRFDPTDPAKVIIDFRVRKGTYVTHATYAVLAQHGLTGGKVLELKLGKGSRVLLATSAAHPALIPMRQGLIGKLMASAGKTMQSLNDILASAQKLLDANNRKHITATLKNLDAATAQLVVIEKRLGPTLKQLPALVKGLHQSIHQTHALLANANQLVQTAQGPVKKLGGVEDSAQHLVRKLDTQTAPGIDTLVRSLTRTSRQLQALIKKLKANPQMLIFGSAPPPPGPGEPGFDAGAKNGGGQ